MIRYLIESQPADLQLIRNLFILESSESGSNLLLSFFCSRQLSDEDIHSFLAVFSKLHKRDQHRFLDEKNRSNMTARSVSVGKPWQNLLPEAPISVKKRVTFADILRDENPGEACQPEHEAAPLSLGLG